MRRRWVFWVVAGIITAVWVAANLPRVTDRMPDSAEWKAGRPISFVRWYSFDNSSDVVVAGPFAPGALLIDVAVWAVLIFLTWRLTRRRGT